ncbi:MAG: LOG family protein, partial [Burkholderiales bacterium]|nr:LOG family protein [Burkholderiales bacterium]
MRGAGLSTICVFGGSQPGRDPRYTAAARATGHLLATHGIGIVYGGGGTGMMGAVADGVLAAGGRVTGVIPELLMRLEKAHPGVTDMRVVTSMH